MGIQRLSGRAAVFSGGSCRRELQRVGQKEPPHGPPALGHLPLAKVKKNPGMKNYWFDSFCWGSQISGTGQRVDFTA